LSFLGNDLAALLAVLAELDEYATVSNTNVHLLAGLGRSARVLVPYPAEWRWMRRDGSSPWFPNFPVYRQTQSRDWAAALAALRKDLKL
ncbi:MAG TPA: glycosyltransferase, partial [Burkholderiales bacterium]